MSHKAGMLAWLRADVRTQRTVPLLTRAVWPQMRLLAPRMAATARAARTVTRPASALTRLMLRGNLRRVVQMVRTVQLVRANHAW